jgi:hypothetical protein
MSKRKIHIVRDGFVAGYARCFCGHLFGAEHTVATGAYARAATCRRCIQAHKAYQKRTRGWSW